VCGMKVDACSIGRWLWVCGLPLCGAGWQPVANPPPSHLHRSR